MDLGNRGAIPHNQPHWSRSTAADHTRAGRLLHLIGPTLERLVVLDRNNCDPIIFHCQFRYLTSLDFLRPPGFPLCPARQIQAILRFPLPSLPRSDGREHDVGRVGHCWPLNFNTSFAFCSHSPVNLGGCLREARSLLKAKLRLCEAKLDVNLGAMPSVSPFDMRNPVGGGRGHAVGLYAQLHQ
jgi:hypothetical protein